MYKITKTIQGHTITIEIEHQEQNLVGRALIFGPNLIDNGEWVQAVAEYDLDEQIDGLYLSILSSAKSAIRKANSAAASS